MVNEILTTIGASLDVAKTTADLALHDSDSGHERASTSSAASECSEENFRQDNQDSQVSAGQRDFAVGKLSRSILVVR